MSTHPSTVSQTEAERRVRGFEAILQANVAYIESRPVEDELFQEPYVSPDSSPAPHVRQEFLQHLENVVFGTSATSKLAAPVSSVISIPARAPSPSPIDPIDDLLAMIPSPSPIDPIDDLLASIPSPAPIDPIDDLLASIPSPAIHMDNEDD